jgi:hypothetical protein
LLWLPIWLRPLRAIDPRLPEELSPEFELPLEPMPLLLIPLLPLIPVPLPLIPLLLPLMPVLLPDVLRFDEPLLLLPVSAGPFWIWSV